jgi:hypothetical protein
MTWPLIAPHRERIKDWLVEHLDHRKFGDTLPNEAAERSRATLGSPYNHV